MSVTADAGRPPSGAEVAWRVTYIGHATVAITIAGTVLLTDPLLHRRIAFLRWHAPAQPLHQVADCDAVLISHLHGDHCDLRSLRTLGRDRTLLVPPQTSRFFRQHGFDNVVPMAPGVVCQIGAVTVTATPAAHDGSRYPHGPGRTAVGYIVAAEGRRLYFAGDTDLFPQMADLAPLDVALLPVAGWGRTIGPGHLDPVRAAEAVRLLRPSVAVPIHWGTVRPLWHRVPAPAQTDAPALAFAAEVRRRGWPTTVAVLPPGESLASPVAAVSDGGDRGQRRPHNAGQS